MIIGLGTSISIVFFIPRRFRTIVATLVELLAAIPSVVYGLWGLLVIAPWMQTTVNPWLNSWPFAKEIFGNSGQEFGTSLLLASIVLGIMILPTFVAISREVIAVVPQDLMEASLSLGATRWQMIREVVLPTAKIGLFGATFLALARATGETVAVALVAGSVANVQFHLALSRHVDCGVDRDGVRRSPGQRSLGPHGARRSAHALERVPRAHQPFTR